VWTHIAVYCIIVKEKSIYKWILQVILHLILVFNTVLGRPRRADAKTSIKNYQGQPLPKKMRFENI
jgi:hypothetical protein